jgi:hypothetical protein
VAAVQGTVDKRASEKHLARRVIGWKESELKIQDLIAELAVFPLNNKIHIKVDGEIRYIREVKLKEPSQDDVVVVEVL